MQSFNIYMIGVGGQGIGLLSEVLLRAADHAGLPAKGVDTHGLAQRGGVVTSHLRIGEKVFSPLVPEGRADLVISLERHEVVRGLNKAIKDGGTLVYYDAEWQPLEVRLGGAEAVEHSTVSQECEKRGIREIRIFKSDLKDSIMQNIVLLAGLYNNRLIPGLEKEHYLKALDDLMSGPRLEKNLALFEKEASA